MATPLGELAAPDVAVIAERIFASVSSAVKVPAEILRQLLVALVAEGHVLIEDRPGVGKTALARALARSIDSECARIQCTSDLLPSDVVGTKIFNQLEADFEFRPGPVFAHLVLVDEINRASPKTQSGLLECMQESQVTVDGESYPLARPFMVMATQNPADYEGTYPLPEAQLDRFMMRVSLGYPAAEQEAEMLAAHASGDRVLAVTPVASIQDVTLAQRAARAVHASDALRSYIVAMLQRTRVDVRVEVGASPRAGLMLLRAAKASAVLDGRDHVLPDDVQRLAAPVLAHRLMLSSSAARTQGDDVVLDAIAAVRAL